MESSRAPARRWHKASLYLNAGRRFFSNPRDDDGEQKDLEKNSTVVRQPPSSTSALVCLPARSSAVIPIKRVISRLVRAAVLNGTPPQDQLQEQQKRCSRYSQKALLFAITTFVAYLGSSASSPAGNTPTMIAMAAFFVAIPVDLISVTRSPKWGCTLVYLSWFLLVLLSYLLLVSFHKDYSCAIIPVLLMFVAALLGGKLQPSSVRQQNTTNTKPAERLDSDDAGQDLENIFEWSAGVSSTAAVSSA